MQDLQTKGLVTQDDLLVKLNFADYVRRFERENMNILEFGENITYPAKIQAITGRLREYARQSINQTTN